MDLIIYEFFQVFVHSCVFVRIGIHTCASSQVGVFVRVLAFTQVFVTAYVVVCRYQDVSLSTFECLYLRVPSLVIVRAHVQSLRFVFYKH